MNGFPYMKNTMHVLLLMVMLLAGACSKGNSGGFLPVVNYRNATVVAWAMQGESLTGRIVNEAVNSGPLEIAMVLSYRIHPSPGGGASISKFEIDFGDGLGWIDVTSAAENWDYSGSIEERDINRLTRHVYTEPGEYLIRGRVTYWDGEVIHTSGYPEDFIQSSDVLVRILSPEEAVE